MSFSDLDLPKERKKALLRASGKWKALYRKYSQEAKVTNNDSKLRLLIKAIRNLQNIMDKGGMSLGRHKADIVVQRAAEILQTNHPQIWESIIKTE